MPAPCVLQGLSFDADGKRLVVTVASPSEPGDAWVLDIAAGRAVAWTHSEAGPVDNLPLCHAATRAHPDLRSRRAAQREIPTYVYGRPRVARRPARATGCCVAGGRSGAAVPAGIRSVDPVSRRRTRLCRRDPGVARLAGFRQGLGRGRSRVVAEDTIKDIGAVLVWLHAQRDLDAQHVVVSGRGLGGPLALDTLVNYSDRVRAGVAQGAISDFWNG